MVVVAVVVAGLVPGQGQDLLCSSAEMFGYLCLREVLCVLPSRSAPVVRHSHPLRSPAGRADPLPGAVMIGLSLLHWT